MLSLFRHLGLSVRSPPGSRCKFSSARTSRDMSRYQSCTLYKSERGEGGGDPSSRVRPEPVPYSHFRGMDRPGVTSGRSQNMSYEDHDSRREANLGWSASRGAGSRPNDSTMIVSVP